MITTAFLTIFLAFINLLIGLLPSVSGTSVFGSTITVISGYTSAVYSIIPLITIAVITCMSIIITFETGYLLFKIFNWLLKRLPTQS